MYLLDTAIVLEQRKAKSGQTDQGLAAWASGVAQQNMFISALTLLELDNSAAQLAQRDKTAGAALRAWAGKQVRAAFSGRILPVDENVVAMLGQLPPMNVRNALLAATAKEHQLTLVTRNVAGFKAARVKLLNPWGYKAEESEDDGDWRQAARTGPVWLRNLFVRA